MGILKNVIRSFLDKKESIQDVPQKTEVDLRDLEFLAQKSNYFIEKQVESYRNKTTVSGTIITVIVIFIPFFISGLQDSIFWIKLISIIPLSVLTVCLVNFVKILKTESLDFGFHTKKLHDLVNMTYEKILMHEIAANKSSFDINNVKIKKIDKIFHFNIKFTLISIIASTVILIITNIIDMSNKENETTQPSQPVRVIPTIDPGELTNLTDTTPSMHLVAPDSGNSAEQK